MFGLSTLAWKIIGYAVIALTILGCGAKLMSIWDAHKIDTLQATVAQGKAQVAQVAAVTKTITVADQAKETTAQAALTAQHTTFSKEISVHVSASPSPSVGCVTWGMLRLHDAYVIGVDPSSLGDPTAQPDDACSTVAPSVFMAAINDNYAAARANAEQLDALEADVVARTAAVVAAEAQDGAPPLKASLPHL